MWTVMTSCFPNKSSWKWQHRRRNVALVKLTDEYAAAGKLPKMISERAHGVATLHHLGDHYVGETDRCVYERVLAAAEHAADRLNAGADEADITFNLILSVQTGNWRNAMAA